MAADPADRSTWQVLVALAGAATAIVIVVYLVGGAIVWERLHVLRLPANQAVAPLPRNYLLINGVRALAWPVALGLIAACFVSLLTHIPRFGARVTRGTWTILLVVWVAGLVVIPIYDTGPRWQHFVFLTALGILVAIAATIANRQHLVAARRLALGAAVAIATIGIVVEAFDIWTLPVRMEYAQVQFTHGTPMNGFYIGATSDAVYLAPNERCRVLGRIVALPQREVTRVVVFTSTEAWSQRSHPHPCTSPR